MIRTATVLACNHRARRLRHHAPTPVDGRRQAPAQEVSVAPVKPPAAPGPQIGTFGFDTAGMDRSVAPGEDWVQFASGQYFRTRRNPRRPASLRHVPPARRPVARADPRDHRGSGQGRRGSNAQQVGDYYNAFMDEAAIEARGTAPLVEDLQPFVGGSSKSELRPRARASRSTGSDRRSFA